MATSFPCLSLFGTKDYSFITETYKCFSARMYTCLEFRTDQNLFTRGRTKFTAISTRFMNLDCESPIHAALEHNYSNIYSDADTQTQIAHTQIFGRLFLSCTVIHHSGGRRRHRHDDNDDDVDDDDDDDDDDTEAADAPVSVVIVIMTLTLSHPPLHQHQESDWLLVGFAAKV